MKSVAFHTLGCKVNAYETMAMEQSFREAGYEIAEFEGIADIYIVNTCSVTNIADRKSRQMLHKAKKNNPDAVVAAVGCYVQAAKEELLKDNAVDLVIGNNRKNELVSIVEEYIKDNARNNDIVDIAHTNEYEEMKLGTQTEKTRAFIKVQDGCNQFCSYCIIPYTRGRVRSRKLKDCINEITKLAGMGYKEVVLTGIHLSSYGVDLEEEVSLIDLIESVNGIEGIERIRLGSLEPRIITETFTERLEKCDKVCHHFHLSLQSGCDATLKRMNRRYNSEEYFEKCKMLREKLSDTALTTDVIVGFPGETEEEFLETKSFLERVNFYETHIFKYSRRAGTVADKMENQVPDDIKALRSDILLELDRKHQFEYNSSYVGRVMDVLFEEKDKLGGEEYYVGHTMNYIKVAVKSECDITNEIHAVSLAEVYKDRIVKGEIMS